MYKGGGAGRKHWKGRKHRKGVKGQTPCPEERKDWKP